ncbi:hypothetical protein Tco_1230073 [Tanacetum coccineum]
MKFIVALVECSPSPKDTISDISPLRLTFIYVHVVDKMPLYFCLNHNWVFLSAAALERRERDFSAREEALGGLLPCHSLPRLDHEDRRSFLFVGGFPLLGALRVFSSLASLLYFFN